MRTARRIAEEEYILVVLLAGFGLIFLLIFPPALLVNDSWLTLMAGREVLENGLPSHDELTVYGLGNTWTDQQWLAQIFIYGVYQPRRLRASLDRHGRERRLAPSRSPRRRARSLGAGAAALWVMFLPVLVAAPWAWSIRAQMLALPLYTGMLWLLASQARRPTRRVWLAFPLLVVWANVHGSVALGALLVMLLGVYELVRSRGRSWLRSVALVVLAPLAVLVTPYGPMRHARYYHLLLVDPPFAGRVTEWHWAEPGRQHDVLLRARRDRDRRSSASAAARLTLFDIAVLALTLVGAVTAIRGIVWFALACMVFVPVAIGHKLESRNPGEPRRGFNVALAVGLAAALVAVAGSLFLRDESWFEEYWPRETVRGRARRAASRTTASLPPTASPTGCSGRSPSCEGASPTTCASRSTTASSSTGSRSTQAKRAPTGSRLRTGIASSSWTRPAARTRPTSWPSPARVRSIATRRSPSSSGRAST